MKALIGILAIAAIACGFAGAALACGPGEDGGEGLTATAALEGSNEDGPGKGIFETPAREGSGAEVGDAYQYPPILPVLVVWMELF